MAEYKRKVPKPWSFRNFYGTNGDTELFEKSSNINGFRGQRTEIILYLTANEGGFCEKQASLFLCPILCSVLGRKRLAFSFVYGDNNAACMFSWVFSWVGRRNQMEREKSAKWTHRFSPRRSPKQDFPILVLPILGNPAQLNIDIIK